MAPFLREIKKEREGEGEGERRSKVATLDLHFNATHQLVIAANAYSIYLG